MKNPKWHRDEVILALDLYFRLKPGQMHARNEEVIKLSEVLNKLPIFDGKPDTIKFRNPNGVGLKLGNFLAIDPSYEGKGMEAYSKLDYETFMEFKDSRELLGILAKQIKSVAENQELSSKLNLIDLQDEFEEASAKEGEVLSKLHRYRERSGTISRKKKEKVLKETGKLACEVCGFDFYETYGEIGKGFIECHHTTPLAVKDAEKPTTLSDLALVCSNCHRMLHRNTCTFSIEELKKQVG